MDGILTYSACIFGHLNEEQFAESQYIFQA